MTNSNIKYITSTTNPLIKEIAQLKNNKKNDKNLYIVEGMRAVETIIENNKKNIKYLFIIEDLASVFLSDIPIFVITNEVLKKISSMATPPGILAVCRYEFPKNAPETPGIVCYEINDPGNLGTLFRTAAALNIKNIICIGGVNPLHQKVIQASAGTLPFLHVYNMSAEEFLKIAKKQNIEIVALTLDGKTSIDELPKNKQRFLVIGNEAHGIPESLVKQCTTSAFIKMPGKTESLNAAIAGSIAMYQLFL